MLYIIGLGLDEGSISGEGWQAAMKCKEVYLEDYTVEFPYPVANLEKIKKNILPANRDFVENFKVLEKADKENVALLVYGSPLTATTHISLIEEAQKRGIKCEVIYNASILDAVGETGLQIYKFGKITSIPNFEAESFMETIKENQSINAHSLILVDIGLEFKKAINRLNKILGDKKVVVCSRLGTKDKRIFYGTIKGLEKKEIKAPFCFIIPGKLHFLEEEVLKGFKV